MNVWGSGPFDNDAALDLISRLLDSPAANLELKTALRAAAAEDADEDRMAEGFAAAEIVASGRGRPGLETPDEVRELLALYLVTVDSEAMQLAVSALRAVREEGSAFVRAREMAGENPQEWLNRVLMLENRLKELSLRP